MKWLILFVSFFVGVANAKNLTVYFSVTGNTQKVANIVHSVVGGDIRRIEPVNEYPHEYEIISGMVKNEKLNELRPEYKDMKINWSEYDTVYIGYPLWFGQMPRIVYGFLENNDFAGKTIVSFNTHGGSGRGDTDEVIRKMLPRSKVVGGLAVMGNDSSEEQTEAVKHWLEEIDF